MQEIRCTKCNKMLATIEGNTPTYEAGALVGIGSSFSTKAKRIEIKCPRCKLINIFELTTENAK